MAYIGCRLYLSSERQFHRLHSIAMTARVNNRQALAQWLSPTWYYSTSNLCLKNFIPFSLRPYPQTEALYLSDLFNLKLLTERSKDGGGLLIMIRGKV
jgi:hypothetical protein